MNGRKTILQEDLDDRKEKDMSPRNIFETEMKRLSADVSDMAAMVEISYGKLLMAWKNRDIELLKTIMQEDKKVVSMMRDIENQCIYIITKQQPIVKDLRIVTAHLKAVTDIKRVGDIISDIAEILLRLQEQDSAEVSSHVEGMMTATGEMYSQAVAVFTESLTEKAYLTVEQDDVIDTLFNKVKTDVINSIKEGNKDPDGCVDVLMLAKYLEKVADHAANICEWEIYRETGDLPHS